MKGMKLHTSSPFFIDPVLIAIAEQLAPVVAPFLQMVVHREIALIDQDLQHFGAHP